MEYVPAVQNCFGSECGVFVVWVIVKQFEQNRVVSHRAASKQATRVSIKG